jgi:hypothetical protein
MGDRGRGVNEVLLSEARAALARGWALIPLNGKVPLQLGWSTAPHATEADVTAWVAAGHNLGLRTGAASGVFVVDVDTAKGGDTSALELPDTPMVLTGGGGRHLYYRAPEPCPGNSASKLAPHVDTRGDGGQVVFVGSLHPVTGQRYEWGPGQTPEDIDLAVLPLEVLARLLDRQSSPAAPRSAPTPAADRYAGAALVGETRAVAEAPRGARNQTLNRAAFSLGQLVAGGVLQQYTAESALIGAAAACGLTADDGESAVLATIRSGLSAGSGSPRTAPERPAPRATRRGLHAVPAAGAPEPPPDQMPAPPSILVPGPHLDAAGEFHEVGVDDFCAAVLAVVPAGAIYRRAGVAGELDGPPGERRFRELTNSRTRSIVDQHCRLVRWVRKRGAPVTSELYESCGRDLATVVLDAAATAAAVRELRMLVSYPVYTGEDVTPVAAGWNADSGVYYDEPPALAGTVPEDDPARIRAVLDDMVVDFPFAADADRDNFLGLLLTPMLRPAIDGNVPLHLIVSTIERAGKTKLAEQVLGLTVLGRETPPMQLGGSDEERDKRILACLRAGDTIVHVDNVREFLDSAALASLLTGRYYSGRVLGHSEVVAVENRTTLVATGNAVEGSPEIVKRIIPIRLQPNTDEPEARRDFRHPDLPGYIRESRPQVIAALQGAVELWRAGGRWRYPRPIGGFESWTAIVGGVMAAAGRMHWLGNVERWRRAADPQSEDLRALVEEWGVRYGELEVTPAQLLKVADEIGVFGGILRQPTERGRLTAFGMRVLRRNVGRVVGEVAIRFVQSGNSRLFLLDRDLSSPEGPEGPGRNP